MFLRKGVKDNEAVVIKRCLHDTEFKEVDEVNTGKFIDIYLTAATEKQAIEKVDAMARKFLVNLVLNEYEIEINPL